MNNDDLFWDRFEAIAWVINENSECVDYIDLYSPYDYIIEDDYNRYLRDAKESKKYRTYLSRWYKEYCDKDDEDIVYDFFCVAFDKQKLNYALEVGTDEAMLDFLRHAYAKSGVKISDQDLNDDIEVIHDIMNEKQQ